MRTFVKIEIVLISLIILSLLLDLWLAPGASILRVLSITALACLYFYTGFAFFNSISLRKSFKSGSFKNIPAMRIAGTVLVGFALSVLLLGILFRLSAWPGSEFMLIVGCLLTFILWLGVIIRYFQEDHPFFRRISIRILGFLIPGLILYALPPNSWFEFKYRHYPEYLQAHERALENPDKQELWDLVDEEKEKIR